jgi:hypothetical protein
MSPLMVGRHRLNNNLGSVTTLLTIFKWKSTAVQTATLLLSVVRT